jgi:uncharacterized membrane protein
MHIRNPMEWIFGQFEAPTNLGSAHPAEYWPGQRAAAPVVQKIGVADLRTALRRGLHDFAAARTDIVFACLIYPVVAAFVAMATKYGELVPLLFPTAAGFALIGPLFATGLYEMSRQRELTGKISWFDTFNVLRSPSIGAIAGLGLLLIGLFLVWLAVAQGIFEITMGQLPPEGALAFAGSLFTTSQGWEMIGLGMVTGAAFAVGVLVISVVSFPLLLDRPVGFGTAIATSWHAVLRNPVPLAIWGMIVAGGLVLGTLPCFIGLIVVLPVLGHATWHLYREIVR